MLLEHVKQKLMPQGHIAWIIFGGNVAAPGWHERSRYLLLLSLSLRKGVQQTMNHANASKSEVWTKCYIDEWWEVAQRIVGRRNYAVSVAAACSSRGRQFFIAVPEACWSTLRSSPEEALIDLSNEFASNKRLVVC